MAGVKNVSLGKSIILNLLCAALAAAAGHFVPGGIDFIPAFLFSLIILWFCNEAWYWLVSLPVLVATLVGEIRKKPLTEKSGVRYVRMGAVSLLLTPHLLFAILYLANRFTQGALAEQLQIPLGQPLFITAFLAVASLWVLNLLTPLMPISVGAIFSLIFEPELWTENVGSSQVEPVAVVPHAEMADGLLYCGKPVLSATPAHVRSNFRTGLFILPFALLAFGMAAALAEHFLWAAGVCGGVALVFGIVAIHYLRWPSLWRKRLEGVEYSFSRDTVCIAEKGVQRSFALDESLNISHETVQGSIGNIYISPTGKVGRALRGILGKMKVDVVDASMQNDISAPLMGFFQIENSTEVFRLLVSCRDNKTDNQNSKI